MLSLCVHLIGSHLHFLDRILLVFFRLTQASPVYSYTVLHVSFIEPQQCRQRMWRPRSQTSVSIGHGLDLASCTCPDCLLVCFFFLFISTTYICHLLVHVHVCMDQSRYNTLQPNALHSNSTQAELKLQAPRPPSPQQSSNLPQQISNIERTTCSNKSAKDSLPTRSPCP